MQKYNETYTIKKLYKDKFITRKMTETTESSLTSPWDRDPNVKWRPYQGNIALDNAQAEAAMAELNVTSFVDKFPKVDRTYADPPLSMQHIGLFSFIPAKGATPNEHGVYGFAKIRGNYQTPMEAEQRAEFLIRNVDSYHKIYHAYVGRPFPVTNSSSYSAETSEIDIRKETTKAVTSSVKDKRDEEQRIVQEIKEREEKLLAESKRAREDDGVGEVPETDPYDQYITLAVKKAQLSWTFLEHQKKLREVRDIIIKTRQELSELDAKHPDFREKYFEKYISARREAGLDENIRDTQDNFIKYMVEDAELPGIDNDAPMF